MASKSGIFDNVVVVKVAYYEKLVAALAELELQKSTKLAESAKPEEEDDDAGEDDLPPEDDLKGTGEADYIEQDPQILTVPTASEKPKIVRESNSILQESLPTEILTTHGSGNQNENTIVPVKNKSSPEKKVPGKSSPEKKSPEKKVPGKSSPEKKSPEKKVPGKKLSSSEKKIPGKKSSSEKRPWYYLGQTDSE